MIQSCVFMPADLGFLNPSDMIVEIERREGEHNIRLEDVLAKLEEVGDVGFILIGGVNYYTGQVFDIKTITEAGQSRCLRRLGFGTCCWK
jgi:kynureninase